MPLIYHVLQLDHVYQHAASFDIIHFHIDCWHFPFSKGLGKPHVTTLHGRLDLPDLLPLFQKFTDVPVVSISNSQRSPLPSINWQRTVYHGIPSNLYQLRPDCGTYLAFIGRISPEKRVDRAVEIARRANIKLKIAAKVDPVDKHYMETKIRPLLDHPLVEFVGEIGEKEKPEFLGNALALNRRPCFPIGGRP